MNIIKQYDRVLRKAYKLIDRYTGLMDIRPPEVLAYEELEKNIKANKKTILYVGIKYDYGKKDWGLSFEHYNFYHTFLNMNYSVIYFDYDRLKQKYGRKKISRMLLEAVYYYQPEILFYFHFHDWIEHDVWKEITNMLPTTTIIWLADDHWRYEETKPVWELFNIVITTDKNGYEKRKKKGYNNVLLNQWGYNHFLYRNINFPKIYDVSFVGRCYGIRKKFIDRLKNYGIQIITFGQGWNNGERLSQSDLIKIYNQSKIVLNISFSSKGNTIQIKGREFEVPGCGSLLLTKDSEEISRYFVPNKEIVVYEDENDAVSKIKYYLKNETERERIAKNGYERVLKNHTYEKRFLDILNFID